MKRGHLGTETRTQGEGGVASGDRDRRVEGKGRQQIPRARSEAWEQGLPLGLESTSPAPTLTLDCGLWTAREQSSVAEASGFVMQPGRRAGGGCSVPRMQGQCPQVGQLPSRKRRGPRGRSAGFCRPRQSGVTHLPAAPGPRSRRISGGGGCRDRHTAETWSAASEPQRPTRLGCQQATVGTGRKDRAGGATWAFQATMQPRL